MTLLCIEFIDSFQFASNLLIALYSYLHTYNFLLLYLRFHVFSAFIANRKLTFEIDKKISRRTRLPHDTSIGDVGYCWVILIATKVMN